ncbi:DUF1028 domain-containing protein [Mesorhizobium sp. A556]
MTFSIAGRCSRTNAFGVAISSSSICVASRCAWVGPLGAVLTQNLTDPALGPAGQSLLRQGLGAKAVMSLLLGGTSGAEYRQIGVVDRYGNSAMHTGSDALPKSAQATGQDCFAFGNLLASPHTPQKMVDRFIASANEDLGERLLKALEAGLAEGGEVEDEHSAGLHVARFYDWPVVDLRVDWHDTPIAELRSLWSRYAPQQVAYESRARNPQTVPF